MSALCVHRPFRAWTETADFGAPCGKQGVVRIRQVPTPPGMGPIYESRLSFEAGFSFFPRPACRQKHVPGGLNPLFLEDAAWESFSQRNPSLVPASIALPDGHILDQNHMLLYVENDTVTTFGKYVIVRAVDSHVIECRQSFFAPTNVLRDLFVPEPRVLYLDPGWQYLVVVCGLDPQPKTCWPCQSPQRTMTRWTLPPLTPNAEVHNWHFQGNRIYVLVRMGDDDDFVVACTEILGHEHCSPYRHIMTLKRADLPRTLRSFDMIVTPRESAVIFTSRYGTVSRAKVFYPAGPSFLQEEWFLPDIGGEESLVFDSAEHPFFSPRYLRHKPKLSYFLA